MAAERKDELVARDYLKVGPPRQAPGTNGKRVKLVTNSFTVTWRAPALTAYSIAFDPDIPPEDQSAREAALNSIKFKIRDIFGPWSFDGLRLIATKRAPNDTVAITSPDGTLNVVLAFGEEIDVNAPWAVTIVNQFFKRQLRDFGLFRMQRDYYERDFKRVQLEGGRGNQDRVRLYRGYATSIEPTLLGLQLQVDVVHRVVRDRTVREMLDRIEGEAYERFGDGTDRAYAQVEREVEKHLIGRTMVLDYNHWTWRIDQVNWDMSSDSEFFQKDGSKTSFRRYIQSRYNIKLGPPQAGVLVHITKRNEKLYFLPELCRLTGISPEEKNDFFFMKSLADHTKQQVSERFKGINKLPVDMNEKDKSSGKEPSPLAFSSEPTEVDGRVLGPFEVQFRDGSNDRCVRISDREVNFPQYVRNLVVTATLKRWLIYADDFHKHEANDLSAQIPHYAPKNAQYAQPEVVLFRAKTPDARRNPAMYSRDFVSQLSHVLRDSHTNNDPYQFVLFVLDDRQEGIYSAVKEFCLTSKDLAVFSQVVLLRNLKNPKRIGNVLSNMLRQVFTKFGAIPWQVRVTPPDDSDVSLNKTMFIGLDVCHFRASGRSTVGVCASMDADFLYYNSYVIHQTLSQEILSKSKEVMLRILQDSCVRSQNGDPTAPMVLPDQIVVFRDGVSNSQMKEVLQQEVEGFRQAFNFISEQKLIGGPYNPKLTVMIVQKRVSLRMVPAGMRYPASAGTVVDTGIVSSEFNDFYLIPCAPHPNAGTATPTRYVILVDDIGFAADDIQQIVHQLSSAYYNWSGAVRVPAPCMYAHKIAYLFGKSLKNQLMPDVRLQGRPYFL